MSACRQAGDPAQTSGRRSCSSGASNGSRLGRAKGCAEGDSGRRRAHVVMPRGEQRRRQGAEGAARSRTPARRCKSNARSRSDDIREGMHAGLPRGKRITTEELRDTCSVSIDHIIELQLLAFLVNAQFQGRYTNEMLLQYVTLFFNDVWNLRVTPRIENASKGQAINVFLQTMSGTKTWTSADFIGLPYRSQMAEVWGPQRLRFLQNAERNHVSFPQASRFVSTLDAILGVPLSQETSESWIEAAFHSTPA